MAHIHRSDPYHFIDTTGLADGADDQTADPSAGWPEAQIILAALAPAWSALDAELGVPRCELDLAQSLVSADLLVSRGAGYFPPVQLQQSCRLLFDLAIARAPGESDAFGFEIGSLIVGLGLARVPEAPALERVQARLEALLAEHGLSGLDLDEDDEDDELI